MASEVQPYVGPRPYTRDDAGLFFGREREANDLLSLVVAHAAVLLYAESGAGKSSLLNAGLTPLLEREGFEVLPPARVRGLSFKDIAAAEIPNLYVFNVLASWAKDKVDAHRLASMSLADFLQEQEHPLDADGQPLPRVVILDQLEELFTLYPERWKEREGFLEQVGAALEADTLLRFVLATREDYIAQLDPYVALLPEKLQTRFRLERLRQEPALLAVKEPLRNTPRRFTESAARKLVEELLKARVETLEGESVEIIGEFVEPVQLQVVCENLWQNLPPDVTIIEPGHLQVLGDVNHALAEFYERCIQEAARQTRTKESSLREWFEHDLITPAGTRGMAYRGKEKTGKVLNTTVDALEHLHLIRGEWRSGSRWYELTHDRFIKPIQESNVAWQATRRARRQRIGVGIGNVFLLAMLCAFAHLASEAKQTTQRSQATATASAAQLSDVKATAAVAQWTVEQLNLLDVSPSLLWDFKSQRPHKLAVQGANLFVLDRTANRVLQLTLNEAGDGVMDHGEPPTLVYKTQNVSDRQVGDLIDLVWMPAGGARTRSSLLVLDSNGLLEYDLAWNVSSVPLGQGPVPLGARAIAAFGGDLYVLDPATSHLWRYRPQGNGYAPAESYFDQPPGDLSTAIDLAIDGSVYILYADGRIRKFFGGVEKNFTAGVYEQFKKPIAFATDAGSQANAVYVADGGAARIMKLNLDGTLVRQIQATNGAFEALQGLAVDESNARMYVISGGKLYFLRLPPSAYLVHVLKPGETLFSISRLYGVTPSAIIAANQIANVNAIYVGQTLIIPK